MPQSQSSSEVELKNQDFDELIESVREAGQILRGEAKPSRELTVAPEDVRAVRKNLRKIRPARPPRE
jgi:hypothetical protein